MADYIEPYIHETYIHAYHSVINIMAIMAKSLYTKKWTAIELKIAKELMKVTCRMRPTKEKKNRKQIG